MSKRDLAAAVVGELEACRLFLCPEVDLERSRRRFLSYLAELEGAAPSSASPAAECVRRLRGYLSPRNEALAGFSCLAAMRSMIDADVGSLVDISPGFLCELYYLLAGCRSELAMGRPEAESAAPPAAEPFPEARASPPARRAENRDRLLGLLGATPERWNDPAWQRANRFCSGREIERVVRLAAEERRAWEEARALGLRFAVTPYWLSLLNADGPDASDRQLRARAFPSIAYCRALAEDGGEGVGARRGEGSGRDRIYASYAPDTTAVMLPRRGETALGLVSGSDATAFDPIAATAGLVAAADAARNPILLLAGLDPLSLEADALSRLLAAIADLGWVERILLSCPDLVALPMALDEEKAAVLAELSGSFGRGIGVVAAVGSAREVTDELKDAIARLRRRGIHVGDSCELSFADSQRREFFTLRKALRAVGFDSHRVLAFSGDESWAEHRVPFVRIAQAEIEDNPGVWEGFSEATVVECGDPRDLRLLPLRAFTPVMILADGTRLYRPAGTGTDGEPPIGRSPSVYGYLRRIDRSGGDPSDYASLWYLP